MGRRLGPQVLRLFGRGGAAEYLVAVRVAPEARYDVAGPLGLRETPNSAISLRCGGALAASSSWWRTTRSWLVVGLLAAEELEDHPGISEGSRGEEAGYQTVGGMVMDALGRVPEEGDRFELEGHSFEVLDMEGWRVNRVLVSPVPEAGAEEAP